MLLAFLAVVVLKKNFFFYYVQCTCSFNLTLSLIPVNLLMSLEEKKRVKIVHTVHTNVHVASTRSVKTSQIEDQSSISLTKLLSCVGLFSLDGLLISESVRDVSGNILAVFGVTGSLRLL